MLQELRRPTPEIREYLKLGEEEANREYVPSDGVKPLATWWIQKTPGTTYWRATIPARHLPGQALALRYSDLKVDDGGCVFVPRQRGDTAIWQFVGNATRALIMAHQQEQGHRVLMEVDDNYLVSPPHLAGVVQDWGHKLDRSKEDRYSMQAHRKIVRWVDGVIVSTERLAELYERATKRPIYICPNSIDLDDWPEAEKRDGPRAIGYAGSASHRFDLGIVARALGWASREKADVYRLGADTAAWNFPHKQLPWTDDLVQYRRNLQVLDVGLCPLKRGDWADCKSDIKCLEYLLAGAVPIIQGDSPCYSDWVGVVPSAVTEKDWLKRVKWAVGAPQDELDEVWRRGMDFLLAHKLIGQHVAKWRAAVA